MREYTDDARDGGGYGLLESQLRGLLEGERDVLANASNFVALLYHGLPEVNWVGFYRVCEGGLLLGPFQGRPACVRLPAGCGVCGAAAERRATVMVADVEKFPGHIACDPASRSEIVVPVMRGGELLGVLDIDSPVPGRFGAEDQAGLERLVEVLMANVER